MHYCNLMLRMLHHYMYHCIYKYQDKLNLMLPYYILSKGIPHLHNDKTYFQLLHQDKRTFRYFLDTLHSTQQRYRLSIYILIRIQQSNLNLAFLEISHNHNQIIYKNLDKNPHLKKHMFQLILLLLMLLYKCNCYHLQFYLM